MKSKMMDPNEKANILLLPSGEDDQANQDWALDTSSIIIWDID